jgi:hypothetical protein
VIKAAWEMLCWPNLGDALRASSLVLSIVLSYEHLVSILWRSYDVGQSVDRGTVCQVCEAQRLAPSGAGHLCRLSETGLVSHAPYVVSPFT